jgi:hypothetical protein
MKSFNLATLAGQYLKDAKSFAQRYPHDWLIWEPGEYKVPARDIANARTISDAPGHAPSPRHGDPLFFALQTQAEGAPFSIGRAEGNDLVLSDETISRRHCTLSRSKGGWIVACDPKGHEIKVDGAVVTPGNWSPVSSGQSIELGHVHLKLISSDALQQRFQSLIARRAH